MLLRAKENEDALTQKINGPDASQTLACPAAERARRDAEWRKDMKNIPKTQKSSAMLEHARTLKRSLDQNITSVCKIR